MSLLLLYLINFFRWLRNGWRRLLRRRIDWVRMQISGSLPEIVPAGPWWRRRLFTISTPLSMQALRRRFAQIAADPRISGMLLTIQDLNLGWATIEDLHEAIGSLRAAGKLVVAYLPAADTRGYLAVCVADRLLMPPSAYLNLLGLRIEAQFLGDALRLAGLEADVIAVSPYKSGGDQFARAEISPEAREQLDRLVAQRYALLLGSIAAARGLTEQQVAALIDSAPLLADTARESGLIDAAIYEDEIEGYLRQLNPDIDQPSRTLAVVEWNIARRRMQLPYARRERRYVGLLSLSGMIMQGSSRRSPLPLPMLGSTLGSDSVAQAIRRIERSRRVAALVLHIDSPGGDAFASDLIWRELQRLSHKLPIVVSMGNTAASGGYYIAAGARAIVARRATLTGSIGVYLLRPNAADLLVRAAVGTAVISRGANSGIYSPLHSLDDAERTTLRRIVFESYDLFKQRVRAGRRLSDEQLEPIAGGRVWTGEEAAQIGLIDELGGLTAAVARARALAELPADPHAPLLVFPAGEHGILPPQPFPNQPPSGPEAWAALLDEAMRPRLLAALPWVLREL